MISLSQVIGDCGFKFLSCQGFKKILQGCSNFISLRSGDSVLTSGASLDLLRSNTHVSETVLSTPLLPGKLRVRRNSDADGLERA